MSITAFNENHEPQRTKMVQQVTDLEEIILKYKPLIAYRVKKSLGTSSPDWEDVVSEIILNVIENIKAGKFNGDSSLSTYIYTITTRRIIDHIRKKKRKQRAMSHPDSFPDPSQQLEKKERAKMMAEYLKRLKPAYCDILYSYYYGEFTQREIARMFGISPTRVNHIINHAQRLLRKMMRN